METFKKLFSRRWWWATLLAVLGMIFLVRLGFWQLDRFAQRNEFNAKVVTRWRETPFDVAANPLPADMSALEYRRVQADGRFDYANQLVLKNQVRNDAPGVFLVTPLALADGRAVLVARGWVPENQAAPEFWPQFEEPEGQAVVGLLQESQLLPSGQPPEVPAEPQVEWFRINIDAIQPQMPYELLPVFIYMLPEDGRAYSALPFREEPAGLIRDPGTHLSYAFQWFAFAAILGGGYFMLVRYQERRGQFQHEGDIAGTVDEEIDLLAGPPQEGHA